MSENYKRKVLIELKNGSFLDLLCERQYIMSGKPAVAIASSAISGLVSRGKAKLIAELDEKANQEDFDKLLKDNKGDQKKAIAAFLKSFGKDRKIEIPGNGNSNNSSSGNGSSNQQ